MHATPDSHLLLPGHSPATVCITPSTSATSQLQSLSLCQSRVAPPCAACPAVAAVTDKHRTTPQDHASSPIPGPGPNPIIPTLGPCCCCWAWCLSMVLTHHSDPGHAGPGCAAPPAGAAAVGYGDRQHQRAQGFLKSPGQPTSAWEPWPSSSCAPAWSSTGRCVFSMVRVEAFGFSQ